MLAKLPHAFITYLLPTVIVTEARKSMKSQKAGDSPRPPPLGLLADEDDDASCGAGLLTNGTASCFSTSVMVVGGGVSPPTAALFIATMLLYSHEL